LLMDGCGAEFTQEFHSLFSLPEGGFVKIDEFCQTAMLTMLLSVAGRLNLSGEIVNLIRLQELLPAGGEEGGVPMELNLKFGQELCRLRLAHMKSTAEESIDRVKQYVLQNIADKNLSLSRIAAFTFYNPSYLSRFFKQETGSNLSDYINEVRLNRALELLRNRDVRINEITNRIGFESPSYFTMFFKKRMGVTPNEYRSSLGAG
jgi:two-component system, response regulator YesN